MNVVLVVGAAGALTAGFLVLWCWALGRLEEREARRQAEELRRSEPPVLGGARHRRPGGRR